MQHRDRAEGRNAGSGALSAIALVLALTACASGAGASPEPSDPTSDGQTVVLEANSFEPADLRIDSGTAVTWRWAGSMAHDVVGSDFASAIQTDGTFTHTFDQPGAYDYWCNLHPGMKGTLTVVSS
jgi:plastocyanin